MKPVGFYGPFNRTFLPQKIEILGFARKKNGYFQKTKSFSSSKDMCNEEKNPLEVHYLINF